MASDRLRREAAHAPAPTTLTTMTDPQMRPLRLRRAWTISERRSVPALDASKWEGMETAADETLEDEWVGSPMMMSR